MIEAVSWNNTFSTLSECCLLRVFTPHDRVKQHTTAVSGLLYSGTQEVPYDIIRAKTKQKTGHPEPPVYTGGGMVLLRGTCMYYNAVDPVQYRVLHKRWFATAAAQYHHVPRSPRVHPTNTQGQHRLFLPPLTTYTTAVLLLGDTYYTAVCTQLVQGFLTAVMPNTYSSMQCIIAVACTTRTTGFCRKTVSLCVADEAILFYTEASSPPTNVEHQPSDAVTTQRVQCQGQQQRSAVCGARAVRIARGGEGAPPLL